MEGGKDPTALARRCGSRPMSVHPAPSEAKSRAMARPMPRLPPEITQCFPASEGIARGCPVPCRCLILGCVVGSCYSYMEGSCNT